ncbi:MAG: tRNA pseudouridine(38-40) synthase TruA [Planctomycetota bacterium]
MTADATNFALRVAYDGRAYDGWQRHPGRATVQGALEDAARDAFGAEGPVEGSGRTDRGAHAKGQVATVRLPGALDPEDVMAGFAASLPADVHVTAARAVPMGFHARQDAVGKVYRYVLWVDAPAPEEREGRVWTVRGPLDVRAMEGALRVLVGEHDFATFASPARHERATTVRTLRRAELHEHLPAIEITLEADGFLYKMVRNLVRAVVRAGEGRRTPNDVARMLAARDRSAAPGSAPASGLFLDAVRYDPPLFDR